MRRSFFWGNGVQRSPLNEAEQGILDVLFYLMDNLQHPLCEDPNDNYTMLFILAKLYTFLEPSCPFSIDDSIIAALLDVPKSTFQTLNLDNVMCRFFSKYQTEENNDTQEAIIDLLDVYFSAVTEDKSLYFLSLLMQEKPNERYPFFINNLPNFKRFCEDFNRANNSEVWSYPFFILILFSNADREKFRTRECDFLYANNSILASRRGLKKPLDLFFLEILPELSEKISELPPPCGRKFSP